MIQEWGDFLKKWGGTMLEGQAVDFGHPEQELQAVLNASTTTCSDRSHRGLLAVHGTDTDPFLQGQLTCDVSQITLNQSGLGAFCSPKGRVLASFRLFRREDVVYLDLPQELVEPTLARLRKYVLRAKVILEASHHRLVQFGIAGSHAEALLTERLGIMPTTINAVTHTNGDCPNITVIRCSGITPRFALYGTLPEMQALWEILGNHVTFTGTEPWRLLDILAGLPTIYPETVEAFVPQMLNLDALGGISFRKGCYTGQEVVARMRYLGKLKRRMFLARVDCVHRPQPGDALFSPQADPSQSPGQIVDAARHPDGGYAVLAVALIECAEHGILQLSDAHGATLQLVPLPYELEKTGEKAG